MLSRDLGRSEADVPQVFCPYKEALKLYRQGIDLPDDVTLLWADDNFGYIRQLSNPEEQKRKGGGGVYYHFSYWGIPQNYLWLGSTPPALTVYEMMKAYVMNCRDVWVFNVGDIKPIEYETQYALDFAWNVNSIDMDDADQYGRKWGAEIFGEQFADAIYRIKRDYLHLASSGKPEHVNRVPFTIGEMNDRLAAYSRLARTVDSLQAHIPADLQDAYYQLITYPVKASEAMNQKVMHSRMSFEYARMGMKDEAMQNAELSRKGFQAIKDLTEKYNKGIANGKWDGMMSYTPQNERHLRENPVAQMKDVSPTVKKEKQVDRLTIPASMYVKTNAAGHKFKLIKGLGTTGKALTVWPLNMRTYTDADVKSAPYAEYKVKFSKGSNRIEVRCLPTFPLYEGLSLRYAISVDGEKPQFVSIKTEAETKSWSPGVLQGYVNRQTTHVSAMDREATVRIYFPDAGLVLTSIEVYGN